MKAVIGLYSDGHYEIILYAQASLSRIPRWMNLPGGKTVGTGLTNVGTTDTPRLSRFNDGFIKIFNYNRHTKISALFSHYLHRHRQENLFHLFQPNLPKSWRVIDIPNSEGLNFSSLKIPWYKFPGYFSNTYRTFYFLVTAVLQRLDPSQYQTDNIVLEKKREHNDDAFAFLASIHQKYAYKLAK
jgi:hypothetical protein